MQTSWYRLVGTSYLLSACNLTRATWILWIIAAVVIEALEFIAFETFIVRATSIPCAVRSPGDTTSCSVMALPTDRSCCKS